MRSLSQLSDMDAQTETINSEAHSHETVHVKCDVNTQLLEREVCALIFGNTSIRRLHLVALEKLSSALWN